MAQPFSTIEELPDFDIEFPEGSFDPDPDDLEEDDENGWSDQDNFPYHELDDEYTERQGLDHPINWLH
tara:strand:+ start:186 stop:389 length:204 start_codon:yes stop_codon:yes gene_type:complete